MKSRYYWLIFFGVACVFVAILAFKNKTTTQTLGQGENKRNEIKLSEKITQSNFSSAQTEANRLPASSSPEALLSSHLSPRVLNKLEVRVLDENPRILRLGLFKDSLWIYGSDFVFEKNENGELNFSGGEWDLENPIFPAKHPELSPKEVVEFVAVDFPSKSVSSLKVALVKEYWRMNSENARQIAVWRLDYRVQDGGLISENLMIDMTSRELLKRSSALID